MGMLDRYKKKGGFLQLLILIEGLGRQKQDQFMGLIAQENPTWENALRKRILTWEKIVSWQPEQLREILTRLQPLTLATALAGSSATSVEIVLSVVPERRKIQALLDESKASPAEISTCIRKCIEETRAILNDGLIKVEKIDPEMIVPENIEELLLHAQNEQKTEAVLGGAEKSGESPATELRFDGPPSAKDDSLDFLKKKINQLTLENGSLKHEIAVLRGKLDQIRKIA